MWLEELGVEVMFGLYEVEICYLIEYEWACMVQDILWWWIKLGLYVSDVDCSCLEGWLVWYLLEGELVLIVECVF